MLPILPVLADSHSQWWYEALVRALSPAGGEGGSV